MEKDSTQENIPAREDPAERHRRRMEYYRRHHQKCERLYEEAQQAKRTVQDPDKKAKEEDEAGEEAALPPRPKLSSWQGTTEGPPISSRNKSR
ncbi:hypothetical protein Q7C36_014646 [Tachysurus vachellii]|uniref:Neurogenic mastermind-like N-terminal domain-containing protein n=1 Tax=Tachysurus vachellii TaxID=175792 RepID=A0AA88MFI9_TACVA|nr:hypothetical protein Q7C36_014646 [Tachysurus vachellii]